MNSQIKLLFIIQLTFFLKYKRLAQEIVNTNNLSKKTLNKIKLFKKYEKKDFQFKEGDKIYL